jgi:hypothetical protein
MRDFLLCALSYAFSLLLLLSLAARSRVCLKRSCSRSEPKTNLNDPKIGGVYNDIYSSNKNFKKVVVKYVCELQIPALLRKRYM